MTEVRNRKTHSPATPQPEQSLPSRHKQKATSSISLVSIFFGVIAILVLGVVALFSFVIYNNHGFKADPFPDNAPTSAPLLTERDIEIVAELPSPPGNLAISETGRVFFTFHPQYNFPEAKVAEWDVKKKTWHAYPSVDAQDSLITVLSVRLQKNKLFALDHANNGILHEPKLVTFDIDKNIVVDTFVFPSSIASIGSFLNDFHISNDGRYFYIADTSLFAGTPALIVYDSVDRKATRHLQSHVSVNAEPYGFIIKDAPVQRPLSLFGVFYVRPAVDSIALDTSSSTLYFSAISTTKLFKIPTSVLIAAHNGKLSADELASQVKVHTSQKTSSDGLTTDLAGNVYITDFVNSAIQVVGEQGHVSTLVQSASLLRWPDGLSYGPDNYLYISNSALGFAFGAAEEGKSVDDYAPFHIVRVKTAAGGRVGQ